MTLKIKREKNYLTKLYFRQFYTITDGKIRITARSFVDKGSGSGIFPNPDPGDPKRPDPTASGSATLVYSHLF